MKPDVEVSVIIPAFNAADTIVEAVESVCSQGDAKVEVIVVDDGSTDHTAAVCRTLCDSGRRIRLAVIDNSGPSAARNAGVELAAGEFVCFLDADDKLLPHALERLLIEQNKNDYDCVKSSYVVSHVDGALHTHRLRIPVKSYIGRNEIDELRELMMRNKEHCFSWGWLFRREHVKEIEFPTELRYMEDVVFLSELLMRVDSCSVIDFPSIEYRQSQESLTGRRDLVHQNTMTSLAVARRVVEATKDGNRSRRALIARDRLERLARYLWMQAESKNLDHETFSGTIVRIAENDDFHYLRRLAHDASPSLSEPILAAIERRNVSLAWSATQVAASGWTAYRRVRTLFRRLALG